MFVVLVTPPIVRPGRLLRSSTVGRARRTFARSLASAVADGKLGAVPASYESRLFTITPTKAGYETRVMPGGDQKIGLNMVLVGAFGLVGGLFLPGILRILVVALALIVLVLGTAALVQAARAKTRSLTTLDRSAGTITQSGTVVPIAEVTGIGLIQVRGFRVVGVHRSSGKPLWLSSAAKMPRLPELESAVKSMAADLGVPYLDSPSA